MKNEKIDAQPHMKTVKKLRIKNKNKKN